MVKDKFYLKKQALQVYELQVARVARGDFWYFREVDNFPLVRQQIHDETNENDRVRELDVLAIEHLETFLEDFVANDVLGPGQRLFRDQRAGE